MITDSYDDSYGWPPNLAKGTCAWRWQGWNATGSGVSADAEKAAPYRLPPAVGHLFACLRIPGQGGHDSGMIPVTIPK